MNHRDGNIPLDSFQSALIIGRTKENPAISNGVGKSSVFAAIEWALFNKVHKAKLEQVVREGSKKAQVEFSFEVGGSEYKIVRSLTAKGTKHIYLYEHLGGDWESITQRTATETEDKIQEIIKITYKAFQYSVLFRQADLSGLVEASDGKESNNKSRADILKEPLNLMRYSKKEKLAQEKAKPIKKDIEAKESAAEVLGDPEKDIKASQEELEKTLEQIKEKDSSIKNDLQVALDEKKKNLDKLKSSLSSSDADIHNKVEEQHVKVKKLNHSIKELGDSQKSTEATIKSQKDLLNKKTDQLAKAKEDLARLDQETHRDVAKIANEHKKVCDDELKGSKLQARAEVEYEMAKKSIPETDNCPSCEQSITPEYRKVFEEKANKVLEEKQVDIDFYNTQLKKCRTFKNKLTKELDAAKAHIADVDSLKKSIKSINESIIAYDDTITNAEVDAKRIREQLDAQSTELQEAIKHYDNLKEVADKSDMTELNTKIFAIAREIKVYEQSIESMRTETQSLRTRQGVLEERIKTRTDDKVKLDKISDELAGLRRKLSIHQRVINSFSHKGIPTFIINTCLNELQLETNKTLQELRPDLEVQFDADLNFTYRRNGQIRDYQQLSYGQHVYIALAFKRGLARVVQRKMGVDIRFLEFDEVDSALDRAGTEALATAIKKWQDDFTILVVTHNDDLKDKFSHAILVEEGDDGSETSLVTSW